MTSLKPVLTIPRKATRLITIGSLGRGHSPGDEKVRIVKERDGSEVYQFSQVEQQEKAETTNKIDRKPLQGVEPSKSHSQLKIQDTAAMESVAEAGSTAVGSSSTQSMPNDANEENVETETFKQSESTKNKKLNAIFLAISLFISVIIIFAWLAVILRFKKCLSPKKERGPVASTSFVLARSSKMEAVLQHGQF